MKFIDYAGSALEVDFHQHYGLSLHDFIACEYPWAKLYRLAEALPTASHYRDLILNDEEKAELIIDELDNTDPPPMDFTEETLIVQLTRQTNDLLMQLAHLTAGGGKRPPEPLPRPTTAVERLRDKRDAEAVDELLGLLGVE